MKKSNLKSEKAITLIALIITIIILVILAAVSIRAVYNMGIVNHAINGTAEYAKAAKNENKVMQDTESYLENVVARIKAAQDGEGDRDTPGGTTIMEARARTFADGVEALYAAAAVEVNLDAAAHIVPWGSWKALPEDR